MTQRKVTGGFGFPSGPATAICRIAPHWMGMAPHSDFQHENGQEGVWVLVMSWLLVLTPEAFISGPLEAQQRRL